MRKTSVLMLAGVVVLGLVAAGCGGRAEAKLVTCSVCGGKVEASTLRTVDGKQMCAACADKLEAARAAGDDRGQLATCVVCGMREAKADMVEVDGRWYCSHCAPAGAGPAGKTPAGHAAPAPGGS